MMRKGLSYLQLNKGANRMQSRGVVLSNPVVWEGHDIQTGKYYQYLGSQYVAKFQCFPPSGAGSRASPKEAHLLAAGIWRLSLQTTQLPPLTVRSCPRKTCAPEMPLIKTNFLYSNPRRKRQGRADSGNRIWPTKQERVSPTPVLQFRGISNNLCISPLTLKIKFYFTILLKLIPLNNFEFRIPKILHERSAKYIQIGSSSDRQDLKNDTTIRFTVEYLFITETV